MPTSLYSILSVRLCEAPVQVHEKAGGHTPRRRISVRNLIIAGLGVSVTVKQGEIYRGTPHFPWTKRPITDKMSFRWAIEGLQKRLT